MLDYLHSNVSYVDRAVHGLLLNTRFKKNKKKTGSIMQKVSPPPVVSLIAVFDEMFHCCVIHVICDVVITELFTTEVGHHGENGGFVTCPFVEPVHNEMVLDFLCTLCSN